MKSTPIPPINEVLGQKYLLRSLSLLKLERAEAVRVGEFLNKEVLPVFQHSLEHQLAGFKAGTITDATQLQRVRSNLEAIEAETKMVMARMERSFKGRLRAIGEMEAKWNVDTVQKALPIDIDLMVPAASVVAKIVDSQVIQGHKLDTWLKSFSSTTKKDLMKATKVGIIAGESLPEIGRRIRQKLGISRMRGEWLARTTVSATVNNIRDETLKGMSDLLSGVQWLSTLDMRTTEYCIHMDGKILPVDDGPRPPGHFNCRSTTVPVVKSWKEYGLKDPSPSVRSSMDGYVPSAMDYKMWAKSQGINAKQKLL